MYLGVPALYFCKYNNYFSFHGLWSFAENTDYACCKDSWNQIWRSGQDFPQPAVAPAQAELTWTVPLRWDQSPSPVPRLRPEEPSSDGSSRCLFQHDADTRLQTMPLLAPFVERLTEGSFVTGDLCTTL